MTTEIEQYTDAMAELVVRFGANVQPGQVVAIGAEPGKEQMVRAIAEHAYRAGAKFVDLSVFDVYLKRARALYGSAGDLGYVPPWMGERVLELGELRHERGAVHGLRRVLVLELRHQKLQEHVLVGAGRSGAHRCARG